MIIGVVGKSGAGKNYIAEEASIYMGLRHFDLDLYGHKVVEENLDEINELFYRKGYIPFKWIKTRTYLAEVVFSNKEALETLNNFIHPLITKEVREEMKGEGILNGAVLHKSHLLELCDYVLYVQSPLWKRIWRLCKRDKQSLLHIFKRIYSQRDIKPELYEKNVLIVQN